MRILVTTIPFSGMKIDAPISLETLNSRLQEGSYEDSVIFLEAPMADLTLTRTHGGVMVKGIISGRCKQECGTCSDPVPHEIAAPIDWLLQTDSDRAGHNDELDDPGVIVYQGEHVELEDHLQEALILQISPFWHPPRDEHERCSVCPRDCSRHSWRIAGSESETAAPTTKQGSSFGSLLQGALAKGKK
jgi:uncharacterized metal-binding protein YceD (DUF177 family)